MSGWGNGGEGGEIRCNERMSLGRRKAPLIPTIQSSRAPDLPEPNDQLRRSKCLKKARSWRERSQSSVVWRETQKAKKSRRLRRFVKLLGRDTVRLCCRDKVARASLHYS